jgi:hypothetical protein
MRLVHVINVVLVLHGLSIMLVLKYLCKDAFGARGHARMVNRAISTVLYAHASSVHGIELILHTSASRRPLTARSAWIVATLCY